MTIGSVTQKLRPLRLAFLVNPDRPKDVLQAIQLSSTLWGGAFNPLIPCYRGRVPPVWNRNGHLPAKKASDITDGYLDGFDPDIIVPVSKGIDGKYSLGNRDVARPEELIGNMLQSGSPDVGIGAIELVHHLADKEFKFVRQDSTRVVLPVFEKDYALFLSSVFGAWSSDVAKTIKSHFGERMPLVEPECRLASFEQLLSAENLFPRRIGVQGIEYNPRDACIHCLDATSTLDVIDYWNLRAAGYQVIPAPKQAFGSESLRQWLTKFIEISYREDERSFFHTTVQVGRSLDEKDVISFLGLLNIKRPAKEGNPKHVVRTWYPRLWDRWARENTDERPVAFYAADRETSLDASGNQVDLKALAPDFPHWGRWRGQPQYVNELSYSVYGASIPMAEVLPEGSREISTQFGISAAHRSRLSRTGPTYYLRYFDRRIFFEIPQAESFMLAWFRAHGWDAELSSPGLIATQMLKRLHGRDGIYTICSERLIKLLDKHASERREQNGADAPRAQKWIKERTLGVEIERIIKEEELHFDGARYVRRLLESSVLGLGLELHCPTCLRWLWKSVEQLDAEVECEQCLSRFQLGLTPQNEREWSYKPTGPFNVRGYGGGAYPVLLTWKFFSGLDRKRTTPLLSFNAKKGNINCEVDLALFCEDGSWRSSRGALLLAECKAYDRIRKHDVARMERLGAEFQGATLVFSKFSPELDAAETRLLVALVNRQRKLRLSGKPYCATIILTGTELFSLWGVPKCWEGKGEPHENWSHVNSLAELAEATQNIYLGMPPFHRWAESRLGRR